MRILFLSTVYPTPWEPHKGPANRSTVESLRALGHEVHVVAPVPWRKRLQNPRHSAPPGDFPTYWYPQGILRQFYHRALWLSVRRTLQRVFEQFQPEAVLAFWAHPDGTVALQFARMHDLRVGIIIGGSDVMLLPKTPERRRRVANTLRHADHVFAVGSELSRRAIDLGVAPERVSNFFCGVDLTIFGPGDRAAARAALGLPADAPVLLWIGNMVPVKAAHRVLEAGRRLVPAFSGLRIVMIGNGPLRGELMAQVSADPELRERVIFPGSVNFRDLPAWYHAADLVLLSSRSEGVPNVLLEGMATGTPFVASDVGSIRDLLPFGPSRVVPEGDVPALAFAIEEILRNHRDDVIPPRRFDRLDGAHHLLDHLQPVTG